MRCVQAAALPVLREGSVAVDLLVGCDSLRDQGGGGCGEAAAQSLQQQVLAGEAAGPGSAVGGQFLICLPIWGGAVTRSKPEGPFFCHGGRKNL